jgi:hypothetical protein
MLEMANARLTASGATHRGVVTGKPQNEVKHSGEPIFAKFPARCPNASSSS